MSLHRFRMQYVDAMVRRENIDEHFDPLVFVKRVLLADGGGLLPALYAFAGVKPINLILSSKHGSYYRTVLCFEGKKELAFLNTSLAALSAAERRSAGYELIELAVHLRTTMGGMYSSDILGVAYQVLPRDVSDFDSRPVAKGLYHLLLHLLDEWAHEKWGGNYNHEGSIEVETCLALAEQLRSLEEQPAA